MTIIHDRLSKYASPRHISSALFADFTANLFNLWQVLRTPKLSVEEWASRESEKPGPSPKPGAPAD